MYGMFNTQFLLIPWISLNMILIFCYLIEARSSIAVVSEHLSLPEHALDLTVCNDFDKILRHLGQIFLVVAWR